MIPQNNEIPNESACTAISAVFALNRQLPIDQNKYNHSPFYVHLANYTRFLPS
jgi:hypothetical protein